MRRRCHEMKSETGFGSLSSRAGHQMNSLLASSDRSSPLTDSVTENGDVDIPEVLALLGKLQTSVQSLESHLRPVPRRPVRKPRLPSWVTKNILLITLVWQVGCVLGLTVVELTNDGPDRKLRKDKTYYITLVVLAIFQAVNILLVIITSVKLTKQIMHHTASASFLFQSYSSTLLLFAGMYTLLYRIESTSFDHVIELEREKSLLVMELFLRMLFLSTSNATLCGTSKISPETWYAIILVMTQMLLSFIYFTSILSQATSHYRRSSSRGLQMSRRTFSGSASVSENTRLLQPKHSDSGYDVLGESTTTVQ